jgi:MFS family permease
MSLTDVRPDAPAGRRTLGPATAYGLMAFVLFLGMFASTTPSPLYATYRQLWGFSSVVLTMVFAIYALGVLVALLVAGQVSDVVGRRPVLLAALGTLAVTTVLFMAAQDVAWLFVARALQGLATGLSVATASAALVELHPRGELASAGRLNAVSSTGGMALGIVASSAVVEWLPAPRVMPYVVLLVLFVVAIALALRMPEPVADRGRLRLTVQRPHVPASVRRPFVLASLAVIASWSIGGLLLSVGPALAGQILDTHDHLVTGLAVALLPGSGAVAILLLSRTAPWLAAASGALALAVGMVVVVVSVAELSAPLFLLGAVVGGAGFGVAFSGALRSLTSVLPPHHRAGVMSAFYVVAYLSLSVPAVIGGLLVTTYGVDRTFEVFGSVIAVLALVVAAEAWRTRPRVVAALPHVA